MKAGAKTTEATRILWSLVLGLGLVLGLLWVMMPHSAAEAQTDIGPGLIVEPSIAVVLPVSTPVPMPPRPFSPPLGGIKGGTPLRNPPALPSEDGPSPLSPASARIPEGPAPGSGAGGSDSHSGAATSALYATKGVTGPHIRLEKNEDYYDAAGVVITQVTSLFIDEDEAWSRYQSGELDTIAPPLSALDEITSGSVYSSHLHVYPGGQCTYYYGFSNDVPPFDDPLVRAAFASAIDRPRLISETGTLSGDELPALTFTPPGSFGHVDGYATGIGRPYSPTLAQDLLAASGYTGTPTITLMYNTSPGHQAIAEAVRQMWIDTLGVTVTLQDMEWGSYLDLLSSGSADERPGVFRLGWCGDYPDANNWHNDAMSSNRPRYNNPAYDAVVSAAATETLTTTRLSLYQQAESYLVMTDTAISPLYYYINHNLTRPDLVRTYRSLGGQHLNEWDFTGAPRPLEIAWGSPSTLDPARASDSASINYVEQLFLGLTDYDEEGNVVPELATGWEVSADSTIYTFTMRSDVTWTNSISVVTAYDVEYGVLRSLDPATGSGYAYVLYIIENAQEYNWGDITDPDLVGVKALDDTHVRFTLTGPASYFPAIAGLPPARPQPQWAIETHGSAWTDPANIVTNGPYKLAHWDQMPHLRINKWGDGDPMAGSTFVFNIQYWNDGGVPAENTVITDTMLGGMTYISDTSPFTHTGSGSGPIVWYLGTLSAHTSVQFEVHVQVTAAPSQTITNQAQIATSNPDDQGDQWEKESEWSGHVEGPRMRVDYANDFVGAVYPAGHTFCITVTDSGSTVKATASLSTTVDGAGHGYWGYDGFVTEGSDWSPSQPDIQPDDRVHFQSDDGYSNTIRIGEITGELDVDADTVSGTISAPWFTQTLQGIAGAWGFDWEEFTVNPAGGSYFIHFSEDLQPGWGINVEYVEPDGDKVINIVYPLDLVMNVNYGHDWVEGNYETGHTVWITVTESDGSTVKGTAELTTGVVPWWGGQTGFSTNWQGWTRQPDIQPGDWVYGLVHSASYTTTVQVGDIDAEVDTSADTISGTLNASWLAPDLVTVRCEIHEENGPDGIEVYNVNPDGGSFFCDFGGAWDIVPGTNVAVNYTEPDGDRVQTHPLNPAPQVGINKWADGNPGEGGNFIFQVQYGNNGGLAAENTVITDTLLGGMTYLTDTSGFPHTGSGSGPIVWDLGTLPANSWDQFDVFVQVTAAKDDWITNTVQIATSNPYDQGEPHEKESEWSGHVEANDTHLNVGKNAWTHDPAPGYDFVFSVNVCNNGSTGSTEVVLTDTLHLSTTLQSWWSQHTGWTEVLSSSHQLVVSRPSIPGWWCGEIYLRVYLDDTAWSGMSISNTAVISASNDMEDNDNETTWWGNVNDPHTNLNINKQWNGGQLVPGGEIRYWIHYYNNGNTPVTSTIRITDTLPVSTTFNSAWHHDQYGQHPVTPTQVTAAYVVWEINGLDNGYGDGFEVVLDVDYAAPPGAVLTNTIAISPQPSEDSYDDNTSIVVETLYGHGPNLRVRKSGYWHDWGSSTRQAEYNVTVENVGDEHVDWVTITDAYPSEMRMEGGVNLNYWRWWDWHDYSASHYFTVTLESLYPGERADLNFYVITDTSPLPFGLVFTNTVEVTLDPDDTNPADNVDDHVLTTGPDLYVEKTLAAGDLLPGELITFSLRFGNAQEGSGHWGMQGDAQLTDVLPNGLEYIASTRTPDLQIGSTSRWILWPLNAGEWNEILLTARITDTATGLDTFTNWIEIESKQPGDDVEPYYDNNEDTYDVVIAQPYFQVGKVYESGRVAGMPVTYTLTVTNTGHEPGTNVVLSDTLPTGLIYGGSDGAPTGGDVIWNFASIASYGGTASGWFSATLPCTTGSVTNDEYRVVGSDEGVESVPGTAVAFSIIAPTLSPAFDQSATMVAIGETIYFTDTSTTDGTGIKAWAWDFDDGETGSGAAVSHAYDSSGAYTVTLTITDACGFSESVSVPNAVTIAQVRVFLPLVLRNH